MGGIFDMRRVRNCIYAVVAASLMGCGSESSIQGRESNAADASADGAAPLANPIDAATTEKLMAPLRALKVTEIDVTQINDEALWALSAREDAYGFSAAYLRSLAPHRGVLPQLLVPEIKREIKNNSAFQALRLFSQSTVVPLMDVIFKLMINDDNLAAQIRQNIVAKLQKALPLGTRKLANQPLRFDLFPGHTPVEAPADARTGGFAALSQAVRAAYVFNVPDLWNGRTDDSEGNSGLQLLQVARIMAEWRYVLGVGGEQGGLPTGGLLFDAAQPANTSLGRIDVDAAARHTFLFTGRYTVRFEDPGPLGLDLDVREVWQREQGSVDLVEQAMIAETAARAFKRLRPTARANVQSLFDAAIGLFPGNAHELPLALLPGLQNILRSGVIDEDQRLVRKTASLPGVAAADADAPADLKGLMRTLRALGSWQKQLASLSPGEIQAAAADQLGEASSSLGRAMQLLSYLTLRDHLRATAGNHAVLLTEANGSKQADPALFAEALATLIEANTGSFASDFLAARIEALFRYYVTEIVAKGQVTDVETAIWTIEIFARLAADPSARARMPWLTAANSTLESAFRAWNDALRNEGGF